MKTSANSPEENAFSNEMLIQNLNFNRPISKKEKKGLAVIISHPGKRKVFESLLHSDKMTAMKYLMFISKHPHVHYIRWDDRSEKFVVAS